MRGKAAVRKQRYKGSAQGLLHACAPKQAKRELVESYKRLRSEDAAPGSSTSYRITVRQLEALVRLSEALARLRCTNKILPAYVREVGALLLIPLENPKKPQKLPVLAGACHVSLLPC